MKFLIHNTFKAAIVLCLLLPMSSCKKFVDIGTPDGTVPAEAVFSNDAGATAAVAALYSNTNFRDAMLYGTLFTGASADELQYNYTDIIKDFETNTIAPSSSYLSSYLWMFPYREIVNANIAVVGLTSSTTLTPAVRNQLLGEAKFWRALTYLQLNMVFGGVPLSTSDQPLDIALYPRSSTEAVNAQILADLKDAKALLTATYPSAERARVNVYAVSALLARVYLYQKDWANAETEATAVISSGVYSMSALANTFVKTSNETILQIYNINGFTQWGATFVPSSATATPNWYLKGDLVAAFEDGDARKTNWIAQNGTTTNYYANKYKLRTGTAGSEYYVVLRLAEQYLIRAEARAQQNRLTGANSAETDINVVRNRASLGSVSNLTQPAMLAAIEKERRSELFAEWFHRWFDLKRTAGFADPSKSRADEVLSVLKGSNWQSTDVLYPISAAEITKNPALIQNPGY